jgi:hypothetical protein
MVVKKGILPKFKVELGGDIIHDPDARTLVIEVKNLVTTQDPLFSPLKMFVFFCT